MRIKIPLPPKVKRWQEVFNFYEKSMIKGVISTVMVTAIVI